MRARWTIPYALLFGLLCARSVKSEAYAVQPRQDVGASQFPSATQSATLTTDGSSGSRQSSNNAKSTASTAPGSDISSAVASESSTGTATSSNTAPLSTDSTSSTAPNAATVPSSIAAASDLPPSAYKGSCFQWPTICIADICRESLYRSYQPPSSTQDHTGFFHCWCHPDGNWHGVCPDWNKKQTVRRTFGDLTLISLQRIGSTYSFLRVF